MILSKKLSEAFNAQVNAEMWSSNLYLSMSVHFQKLGLNGFAHWMKKQAEEEMEHAHKMIDFTIDRGGDITIGQIMSFLLHGAASQNYSNMFTNTNATFPN